MKMKKLEPNELWEEKKKVVSRTTKAKAQSIFRFSITVQKEGTQLPASGHVEWAPQ